MNSQDAKSFDYVIAGAGLFGAVMARQLTDGGKKVLVLEKKSEVGGNIRTENGAGYQVHRYGAHMFHTNSYEIWQYVQKHQRWFDFRYRPLAIPAYVYNGISVIPTTAIHFPINKAAIERYFGFPFQRPQTGKSAFDAWRSEVGETNRRLDAYPFTQRAQKEDYSWRGSLYDVAVREIGDTLYRAFIAGYTKKQWGVSGQELPGSIWKRLRVRATSYNDDYFDDVYQALPYGGDSGGYTGFITRLLRDVQVLCDIDIKDWFPRITDPELMKLRSKIIYSGPIDELFDCDEGALPYRSLRWETVDAPSQGHYVINYCDERIPYTRSIEHQYLAAPGRVMEARSLISYEYPIPYSRATNPDGEPHYPIPTEENNKLAKKYIERAHAAGIVVGGRLGSYRYMNMDQVIAQALFMSKQILTEKMA